MTEELPKSIEQLREVSAKLNEATNNVTDMVVRVEKFLNEECSIGIAACLQFPADEKGNRWLDYSRHGGSFRILVVWMNDNEEEVDRTPVVECPRQVRLEAIHHLPNLLAEITKTANVLLTDAQKASTEVSEMLSVLKI